MNTLGYACYSGDGNNLKCGEIASVYNIRFKLSEQLEYARIERNGVTRRLVEFNELNIRLGDAIFEVADRG